MLIYGIDPGFKGKPILDHHGILSILEPEGDGERVAWIEQVGAMPRQGVSSVWRFGEQVGALHMALAATKTPMRLVTPAKWKGFFGLSREKGLSRGVAMQRFADKFKRVKDDGRAEATLIALYGKEVM